MKVIVSTLVFLLVGGFVVWSAAVATSEKATITADEALKKLLEGNERYVNQQMTASSFCDTRIRDKLAKGQNPYAVILSCSDSRVPPELVFDKGLGELFVVRVAGNVPDPIVLGSIEYAVEHLGSPLIMVLGHERCGAVTAAVDAKGRPEGNVGAILKTISPSVTHAKHTCKGKDRATMVECAIDENIRNVAAAIPKRSKIVKDLVHEGKVKIVIAKYDLDDGKVTLMTK